MDKYKDISIEDIGPAEGKVFELDDHISIESIFTPGHIDDHVSFLMVEKNSNERILFSGDIILDSPSTVVDDLPVYMESLYKVKDKFEFDYICVPHSETLDDDQNEHVILDAVPKLKSYIEYREKRVSQLK